MQNYTFISYAIYLLATIGITYWVGKNLHFNGYYLILELFENQETTKVLNNLLLILYYLLNMGYGVLALLNIGQVIGFQQMMEILSLRIGVILCILGFLHFNNILSLRILSKHKHKIINFFNL